MEKVITTMLLIIASVVGVAVVINVAYPAIASSSNSVVRISQKMNDRLETQIKTVFATAELDKYGNWQDTDADGYFDVFVWVKNVGSSTIQQNEIFKRRNS